MTRIVNLSSIGNSELNFPHLLQVGSHGNDGVSWFGKLTGTQVSGGYSMTGQSFGTSPATGDTVQYFNSVNASGSLVITQLVSTVVNSNTYNISLTGDTLIANTLSTPTTLYGYRPALHTSYGKMARITSLSPYVMCDYTNNFAIVSTGTYYKITGTTGSAMINVRTLTTSSGAEHNYTIAFANDPTLLIGDLIYQQESDITHAGVVLAKRSAGVRA